MEIKIFPNLPALSQAAAQQFVKIAHQTVRRRGDFVVCLSGGGTPQLLFETLGQTPMADEMPWQETNIFWGDERCVPPTIDGSNYKQAMDAFGRHLPAANIYRVRGELPAAAAAQDYAVQLKRFAGEQRLFPRFDIVLLGLGGDGHTASLFPGGISDSELTQPTLAITAEYAGRPAQRVTLTPLVLNAARQIWFLVAGAKKAGILAEVVQGERDLARLPGQRIQPVDGELIFWADKDAGSCL